MRTIGVAQDITKAPVECPISTLLSSASFFSLFHKIEVQGARKREIEECPVMSTENGMDCEERYKGGDSHKISPEEAFKVATTGVTYNCL